MKIAYMFHVEHRVEWRSLFNEAAGLFELKLGRDLVDQFCVYAEELIRWNHKTNLTRITEPQAVVVKHFLDSLAAHALVQSTEAVSLLDIGSGAGFPGLPLKLFAPQIELTLLEPNNKKTAFLRHVIGTLSLEGTRVIADRLDHLLNDPQHQARYSHATSRALDPVEVLSGGRVVLKKAGRLLLWRTASLEPEDWHPAYRKLQDLDYVLPWEYGKRRILVLENQ